MKTLNETLVPKLAAHVDELKKKDPAMAQAVRWELIYESLRQHIDDDLELLCVINSYLRTKGLDLKLVSLDGRANRINKEGEYYTINGGQFIVATQCVDCPVSGRVFRDRINRNALHPADRANIVTRFCNRQKLTKRQSEAFHQYLYQKMDIRTVVKAIMNDTAMSEAREFRVRNKLIREVKWNSLDSAVNFLKKEGILSQ